MTSKADVSTHCQSNPNVQLRVLLLQDTDDLISFRKLVKVELDDLENTNMYVCYYSKYLSMHGVVSGKTYLCRLYVHYIILL